MGSGRKKIEIKKIENVCNRRVTFTKRRKGLVKKAVALSVFTGCRVAVLTFSSANTAFFHGDAKLLDQAAAAGLEVIGNCTTYVNEEAAGSGKNGEGCGDDKDLIFTEDELEDLLADHTVTVDVGADNAGKDASISDIMMEMVPWKKSNCNTFQLIPCSSSSKPECSSADYYTSKNCKDMEMVQYGSSSQKASDELMGISKQEESDQLLLKAFMEDMREQYRLACEAGEMISEDDPFIY